MSRSVNVAHQKSVTERQILRCFTDLAKAGNGYCWHVRDAQGQQLVGMPDVLLAVPPVFALYEIKTQSDRVSALQRDVLEVLARCDVFTSGIIRPVPKAGELSLDQALSRIVCMRPDLEL